MASDMLTLTGLFVLFALVLRMLRSEGGPARRAERRRSARRQTRRAGPAPLRSGHGPGPALERRRGRNRRLAAQPVAVERRLGLERRRNRGRHCWTE